VKGHRDDGVEALIARKGAEQEAAKRTVERPDAVILEEMNEFAQGAFVGAETIGCIEAVRAYAAGKADAVFIERMRVEEGGAAADAIHFGDERAWAVETGPADGNTRKFFQFRAADAALVGEEKGEQRGAGFVEPFTGGDPEVVRNPGTGEDSPPEHSIPQAVGC